jgi:hypothetical protein
MQLQEQNGRLNQSRPADDIDDMMVDVLAREEEAEIEALLSSMPTDTDMEGCESARPESPHFSDEDDYDALFMEFVSQQEGEEQGMAGSQDMEMN